MAALELTPEEARVLGSLIEKETTTPEYYPLTLNALVNACNQKSNRDPIVSYDEGTVMDAIVGLRHKGMAVEITGAGMRVAKYAERMGETLNLGRREMALVCVLMLRGRQTAAELRERAERMHRFTDLEEAQTCLNRLAEVDPPLATRLPRQPGEKEPRYVHLLCGQVEVAAVEPPVEIPSIGTASRLEKLESEVARLAAELEDLKIEFASFRKQFE